MSFFSSRDDYPKNQKMSAAAEFATPVQLEAPYESRIAEEVHYMSMQAAAVVEEANGGVAPDELVSIAIKPEAAQLGAVGLRTEMALHRKSHDPFLVDVSLDEGKGTADIQLL